jgi:hypothetical protein
MNRNSSRFIAIVSVLSIAVLTTVAAHGQSRAQIREQSLQSQQQSAPVVATKAAVDHKQLAKFYEAQAQSYLAQAKQHEAMIAAYKANPSLATTKSLASTIGHCTYYVQSLKEQAAKSHAIAQEQEQLAKGM